MTAHAASSSRSINVHYRLRCCRSVPFALALYDASGNRFHNFSTIEVDWISHHEVRVCRYCLLGSLA